MHARSRSLTLPWAWSLALLAASACGAETTAPDLSASDVIETTPPSAPPSRTLAATACASKTPDPGIIVDRIFCCTATRIAVTVDDPRAMALGSDRYRGWIEAGFSGPFEWRRFWGGAQARGYDAQTKLQLDARVTGLDYIDQERSLNPSNPLLCPNLSCDDYLDFSIHVDLVTEDGALSSSSDFHGTTQTTQSTDAIQIAGSLPLESFSITLDTSADPAPACFYGVSTDIQFSEAGVQGRVVPWTGIAGDTLRGLGRPHVGPLLGQWPTPTCVGKGVPFDIEEPLDTASGRTALDLFTTTTSDLRSGVHASATWSDSTETELTLQLTGDVDVACRRELPTQLALTAPLHLQTTDGRLDATLPATLTLVWDIGDELPNWGWSIETDVLDRDARERILGTRGAATGPDAMVEASGNGQRGSWALTDESGAPLSGESLRW